MTDKISSVINNLPESTQGSPGSGEAPILVRPADADSASSQKAALESNEWSDKCQPSIHNTNTQLLPVRPDQWALVDISDAERLWAFDWYVLLTKQGKRYAVAHHGRRLLYLHREILGVKERSTQVDHRNGNTLDCRRSNLRLATSRQNNANRKKRRYGVSSRFKGVSKQPCGWTAACAGQHLGTFKLEEDAARAYDRAAKDKWGEYARLNFPEAA